MSLAHVVTWLSFLGAFLSDRLARGSFLYIFPKMISGEPKEKKEPVDQEVYDVSDFIREYPLLGLPREKSHFDDPCPDHGSDIIAENHEVNEWVLNHLPLSSEQKKTLIDMLKVDQLKSEKKAKHEKIKSRLKVSKERARTAHNIPIKEQSTKSLIQDNEIARASDTSIEHSGKTGGES